MRIYALDFLNTLWNTEISLNYQSVLMTLRYMKLSEANKVSAVEGIYELLVTAIIILSV